MTLVLVLTDENSALTCIFCPLTLESIEFTANLKHCGRDTSARASLMVVVENEDDDSVTVSKGIDTVGKMKDRQMNEHGCCVWTDCSVSSSSVNGTI